MKIYWILLIVMVWLSQPSCSQNSYDNGKEKKNLKNAKTIIGAALKSKPLKTNGKYLELVDENIRSITPEVAMKMAGIWYKGNKEYYWDDCDYFVDFAEKHNMRIHGHCLIWHYSPKWIHEFKGNREDWIALMKEYITTVVTRYKGRIKSWDVVNEAIDDKHNGLRENSVWYKNIGSDYIDLAFKFAHEADPDCLLFYNEYGSEQMPEKRDAIIRLVTDMKKRGIPINGVGTQMHINLVECDRAKVEAGLKALASTGLLVHISEFDGGVNKWRAKESEVLPTAELEFTPELAQRQKELYRDVANAYLELVPENQRYGITLWGLYDGDTWLDYIPDWPLPFDKDLNPKPAYQGFIDVLVP